MTQTVEDVLTDLSIRSQAFVDGAYVDAMSGETFDCVNPATGRTIASVAACDADDVDRAVRGARAAFESGVWSRIAPKKRKRVLASGCGAVATMLADPETMNRSAPLRGEPPAAETLRALFKQLFAAGARYNETGGIHAAALTDGATLLFHAEDIGRHNAVDKVIGGAVLARTPITGRGLLVTGRISAELAFKAARAGVAWVATPSVPSTLAVTIADRSGMVLVGRAVSGTPHVHKRDA